MIGEKQFSVDPSVQQKLIDLQRESSEFLGMINYVPVDEQSGEKLGLGVAGTLAGRTNTDQNDRSTRDPTTLDADRYECKQTNFDTHVTYAKLDLWAKFKDFQARLRGQVLQQQARDNIMIGWNGIVAAAQTDRAANTVAAGRQYRLAAADPQQAPDPCLRGRRKGREQDRDRQDGRRLSQPGRPGLRRHRQVPAGMGPGRHRTGGHRRQRPAAREIFPHGRREDKPTEKIASDVLISKKQLGGLRVVQVPFFPAGTILITRLDNLSIYEQEGTRRKTIVDNAKRSRIETFESVNLAYVVENFDYALLIEHIEIKAEE